MKFINLLLVIALFIVSCKKEDLPYHFTGKVSDSNGNAVGEITVELLAYYNGGVLEGGGLNLLTTAKTNDSGTFSKNFSYATGPKFFTVWASSKDYYPFYKEYIQDSLPNKVLKINPIVNRYSTLKIIFKNTAPFNNSDIISFGHSYELGGPHDTFIERNLSSGTRDSNFDEYVGNSVEGYELTRTKGDSYTIIQWRTRKNGVSASFKDSIFISGGTQASYNLNY